MSAEETLKKSIDEYAEIHGVKFNEWSEKGGRLNGKDIMVKNILSKFQEIKGSFRRKSTGERVFIEDVIKSELNQKHNGRLLVSNAGGLSRYVSPYSPRTPEQLSAHSKEMTKLLTEQIKTSGLVFKSPVVEKKFIETVASNFIATDSDEGPKFHKVNSNGIVSPASFSFNELGNEFRLSRFIDRDRSELQEKLNIANLREQAARISGDKEGGTAFKAIFEKIQKVSLPTIGKTVSVDNLTLSHELEKETKIEQNIGEFSTLADISRAKGIEHNKMERINSLEDFRPMFDEIENDLPRPSTWDI